MIPGSLDLSRTFVKGNLTIFIIIKLTENQIHAILLFVKTENKYILYTTVIFSMDFTLFIYYTPLKINNCS